MSTSHFQISLLLPIIECGQFAVPGHYSKDVEVSSRFRLFMTRRNTSSNSLVSSTGVNMMLKHAKVIKLNGIPEDDLKEVLFESVKYTLAMLLHI